MSSEFGDGIHCFKLPVKNFVSKNSCCGFIFIPHFNLLRTHYAEFRTCSNEGGMDTQSRCLRVRREDIAYFKFIIESYEGLAVVRTRDPYEAIVELMIAPGLEKDVDEILEGLRQEIPIEYLDNLENPG
jgi:hypothetical protein